MKRKMKIFTAIVFVFLCFLIYLNSNLFIKNQEWKYKKGFHLGDYLTNFESDNTFLCFGLVLIVKNPDKNEFGYYYNKKMNN